MRDPLWYPLPKKDKDEPVNMVRFEYATEKNESVSAQRGRPMHDKIIKATVVSGGSKKSEAVLILERERALPSDEAPKSTKVYESVIEGLLGLRDALERFKKDQAPAQGSGTPLEEWPTLDVQQRADLRAMNIHYVEQLADASDGALVNLGMGARALKQKAQAFLAAARGQAPIDRLVEENDELKRQMAILSQQVAEMRAAQEVAANGR